MNKKEAEDLTTHVLIADILVRVTALEKILIAKGVCTQDELTEEIKKLTTILAKNILQRSNVPGDLDELINELQAKKDETPKN
jgi:hypothetical protein